MQFSCPTILEIYPNKVTMIVYDFVPRLSVKAYFQAGWKKNKTHMQITGYLRKHIKEYLDNLLYMHIINY